MATCNFCKIYPATQQNSHIITDFLTVPMKLDPNGGNNKVFTVTAYDPNGNYESEQDTPKEDYLFCPACESLFNNRFERYIANTFFKAYSKKQNYFDVFLKTLNVAYRVFTNTDYVKFKKFFLLQIYRMHLSSHKAFTNVNLSKNQLQLVYNNLYNPEYFEDIKITIATTSVDSKAINGIFVFPISKDSYIVLINDLLVCYEFDKEKPIFRQTDQASNYNNNSPRVVLLNPTQVDFFSNSMARLIVNK